MADLLEILSQVSAGQWAFVLAVLATVVELVPIKINPWRWLLGIIGKALTKDISDKLEQKDAEDARNHILRFGDEIKNKVRHSEEYFNQILDDITKYEQYCDQHPDFKNARTMATKQIIKDVYAKCLKEKDFL